MKEIGIYVHIPFCKQKCIYCDFISFSNKFNKVEEYINKLRQEIEIKASKIGKSEILINTIYIGGGTPSIISKEYIGQIIDSINKHFNIKQQVEITIEVNPGTVDKEKLEYYKKLGINRLSIGLQNASDYILKILGRIHTYKDFLNVYNMARQVGFKNINVDLMIGVPTQNIDNVKDNVSKILDLKPEHISVYSLIVEENTPIEKKINSGKLILPSEDLEREMYWYVKNKLEENGYKHYEISNFAKEGKESKHNMNCWNQEQYLGFGVAAHSYLNNERFSNTEDLDEYIVRDLLEIKQINEIQDILDKQKEYMMLGLRKIDGVSISKFKQKYVNNPVYLFREEINKLSKEGLLQVNLDNIKLTKKGIDLANLVWEEFI